MLTCRISLDWQPLRFSLENSEETEGEKPHLVGIQEEGL